MMDPSTPPKALEGLHVLIVDDDPVALAVLTGVFAAAGARVSAVTSGPEALASFAAEPPDMLLCDIYMPGMDGFEVIRRVRERTLPAGGRIPALAITAHPSFENRRDALRAGFQDLVGKPTPSVRLVEMAAMLCGRAVEGTGPAKA